MDVVGGLFLLVLVVVVYFLPTIIAGTRGHLSGGAIFAVNLLAGWTALDGCWRSSGP
jgi:Superinfection immunity protein